MKVAPSIAIFAAFMAPVAFAAPAEYSLILEREANEDIIDALSAGGEISNACKGKNKPCSIDGHANGKFAAKCTHWTS
ncbi:hypothetical protein AC579_7976 [Pseudocercospora musae]|uniref:Uncharacterized protein n=1 Tax=Pseudocercospora musae TaxID=113226 RepID=A0A139IBP6_9PEZI|nr:hypothetical protein AC579_7976 [Pseudocercospora musae]